MVLQAAELALVAGALAVAASLRPWRMLPHRAPPWPWIAWWLMLPAFWTADRHAATPAAQALSGAGLLLLMTGWPLAVLAMAVAAVLALAIGGLEPAEALHRLAWLGIVPATIALAIGAALRRALSGHPFVYLLGRGFFATLVAEAGAGALAALLEGEPPGGLAVADVALARVLLAFGDALICGMLVAIFFAFRPHWLATYADRVWLPPPPGH
jgi:uncharacterized membrane protein